MFNDQPTLSQIHLDAARVVEEEEKEDLIKLMPEGVQITDLNKFDCRLLWKH